MAEKKSWRDYSKNYSEDKSTDKPADEEKTGGWRDYSKSYSSDTETQSRESSGSWRDYSTVDTGSIVGSNVVNRVNNWLNSHNEYLKSYQDRYSGRKWNYEDSYVSDAGDWSNTVKSQYSQYKTEADEILSYIDQHKDYLNPDWVEQVKKTLAEADKQQNHVISGAIEDEKWWNNWNNEELVNKYGSAEEAYKYYQRDDGYKKTYTGKTADELSEIIASLEDGEEKEWLNSYRAAVDYDEKSKYDIAAAEKELAEMEAEAEELATVSTKFSWLRIDDEGNWVSNNFSPEEMAEILDRYAYYRVKYDIANPGAALQEAINQKKEYLEQAKYVQSLEAMSSVTGNADFAQNSQYVSNVEYGLFGKPTFTDNTYAYINNPTVEDRRLGGGETTARSLIEFEDSIYRSDSPLALESSYTREALDYITEEEVAIYNYHYATGGKEKADEYLNLLINTFKERKYADAFEKAYKLGSEHPVLGSIASVATSLASASEYLGDVVQYGADKLAGKDAKLDKNELAMTTNAIRGAVADKVDWEIGEWDAFDFVYNTAMSGIDSLASTAFGSTGGVVLGLSAAAQGTNDALDRGMSDGQAFWNGLISGAFEGIFESFSIGNFNRLKEIAPNGVKDIIKNLGKSMLVNASEETLTEIANIAYDTLVNGEFANYTMEELKNGAWKKALNQVIEAGASGALMGVGMSAAGSTIGNASANRQAKAEYVGETDALINQGLQNDVNSDSYKLATEYKSKTDAGKNLSGAQIRKLLAANQEVITANDMQKIQQAAEKRLTELGQTENVSKVAEIATKWATGQEITRAEKKLLTHSQYGSRVANELLPENIDSNSYSTEWAESIGTESVNKAAYNKKAIRDLIDAMASAEDPAAYKSLEERAGTETSFKVSKDGQATIRKSGETIDLHKADVAEFVKDKKGNIVDMVIKADGKEVKASEIDYADGDQSYLFEAVSKIENISTGAATAIIRDYDPSSGQTVGEYLNGIDEGFTYGYYGYTEADLKAGNFTTKLTDTQMKSAYVLGQYARQKSVESKTEAHKNMRTAAQAEAEKAVAEGKEAPKDKNLTITYNEGSGKVVSIDKAGIKDAKRSGAVEVAKILHKLGLGTKVEFFKSYLSKDENGNEIRVFKDDNGVEQRAYSGVYRKSDGTIRIDLDAYNGRGLTLNALSHELTHFIQQWSDEKYKALADFLIKAYEKTDMTMHERVLREQARLEGIRGEKVSYDEAFDEVVANAMSKMFDDGKLVERLTELKAQDEKLARKLWQGFKKILAKFLGIYEEAGALFHDAADLVAMKETFEQLQNMFAEAMVEASGNYQASQQIGLEIDAETESVSPAVMHSEHTWTESDYVQERDKAAKEIAKAIGVSEKKAKDYIDSINSIAKMIAEDRSRLDYFSSPGRTSFVGNVEYGGSFDFSTLCKKRRLLTGTFTAIQKALPNTALTANEILDIRNRMKKAGLEVSCGLCYVEGSRANMGQFAKEFLRLYKQYYPDAWQPNMADVNTPDGIEWVRINHPECYEQYEYFWNHYGTLKDGDKNLFASQQKPKLYQLHTEYKSEILQKFKGDDNVEEKNLNGGIRLQSFSDFEIVHLIDTMQIIMDMSRVGLAGQAYTKVPDFAWALGNTGLKINLSLIAKGVDANGKLIFDDVEGMPIAEAMKLRDRYSRNVGTILVAFNDEQLLAAMADDRVDFIIPFHRSQWKKSQYEAMGLPAKTKDYTFMQNEKFIKPQFHEYRGRMVQDKATNYMPNEYWDFSKSGKENAEAYLEMCARNNKRPKFYKLLQNNGDGSYSLKADGSTDGYWKLLIDFKMYDNEGTGSPQMPVKPEFNMEEANRMLNDYAGGHSNFPVAQGIVDSFVKDYKASHKGQQFSSQETDADRQQYNPFREKFTKERLDLLSDRLGKLFPLSAGFEQAIQNDKTPVSNMTIVANSQKRNNGESFYTVAKKAFKKLYGAKTTFSIKQLGISADADDSFARESIAKASDRKDMQTILDLTPAFKQLIEDSRLLAVERLIHNDKKEKSLLCYRLYNAYIREETYIDANGKKQTQKVPHIVVFSVIQNLADAKAYMVTDIKDVAISNGHNSSKLKAAHANGNISIANIADVYGVVKSIDRKKGGLRYSPGEMAYKFDYTQKESGEVYSSQETDADNAPTFYSKMGKVVEGMKQEKFGATSVISMLRGRGVKAEEIRWSGIQAFLDGKKSVTKQELLDFINGSMLHIEEESRTDNKVRDEFIQAWRNFIDQDLNESEILDGLNSLDEMEGYLESLVEDEDLDRYYADYILRLAHEVGNSKDLPTKWSQYKLDGGENYRELVFKMPGATYTNTAMQTHWGVDAQGVLAHARLQDINTFIGKMLFIEEIQSDWHNEGHKAGYRQEGEKTDLMLDRESKKAYEEFYAAVEKMVYDNANWEDDNAVYYVHPVAVAEMFEGNESYFEKYGFNDEQKKTIRTMVAEEAARQAAMKTAPKHDAVPDAPFKDNYHEFVLKRLLRMAAEEGYDSIGWTTADIQSQRWSDDYVEGYRIEYDQDIPKFLKKYGKQWGAEVGKTNINTRGITEWERDMLAKGIIELVPHVDEVWTMPITPAMKKSVLEEGQAMYSSQQTDIDTEGMSAEAKKIIGNLKLQARFSRISKGEYASYSTERIVREIERSSATKMDYAKSYIAWVKPLDFLYATTTSEAGRAQIEKEAGELDLERLRKQTQPIHLTVDFENGKIVGHEGRHRMIALHNAGVEKVAVIFDAWNDDRYNTKPVDMMRIGGQEFDKYHGGMDFYVHDMLPLSKRYADAAKKLFSEVDGSLRYSEHDTDYSNRSLLANAFEGITQNSVEYKMIQEYKGRIKILNEYEEKLSKLNAEIREIRFTEGKYDAKKLRELEAEAKNVAESINRHDKKLLSLEASEPLRKVIDRERKKEAQKTRDHVKEIQQNKKARAEQTELRHKIRKAIRDLDKLLNRGNKKANVKEDMKGFVSKALELADYLFTDHISNDDLIRNGITVRMTPREAALVKETEDILSQIYDNFGNLTAEEYARLDAKRKSNMDKLRDLLTAQRNERLNTPVYNLFNDLVTEYAALKNSKQEAVKAAYDPNVERFLREYMGESNGETDSDRKSLLQNMRVADMTTKELEHLLYAYTMVMTSVRDANKLHIEGKTETIEQMAGRIMGDFSKRKAPDGKVAIALRNLSNKMGWDYEKLFYALDRIGSEAFAELVMNIANSENIVMQDVMEAAAFRDEMVKNYGFNNWDVNKKIDREFLDNTGKKFNLTLGQMMSLYAYSRRDGAWDHIEYGGFVFGEAELTNPKPADSYKLSKAQCEAITNLLTKEQKGYVEDMQKFLSETMGAKGNEVSMQLYGIKMFTEKNYFPIHIAGQFKAQANESQAKAAAGFSSMSNAGFTHAQNPNAKAPFVMEGFNDVWADHVNEMSRYHGTVPALEDMRKVMNRSSYSESGMESMSVKQMMENSFGKEAVDYFDNLYREANSGAITDKLQKWPKKLLNLFRKNSVAYSLSVLVQQPASLVRAYALIDRKYFGFKGFGTITSGIAKAVSNKWSKAHTNAYNEMLKYAPGVTMAKEIGGFDTATGGSIRSYLLDTGKSFKQSMKTENLKGKAGAVMDLVDDNAIANLPNVADKIAWIEIWNACKRETVAKRKDLATSSEEFMQIVGERFTEVIRATQVYDSIFAKSPMLKSKNLAVQYLVSFMNEPNTTANMVEKAMRDITKGDWKSGARTATVVIHSIIFTNVLKSIIYAMRDDDEDETYIEKYLEAISGGLINDFIPFNYIPIARDVWSLAQGYDVERADMAIVSDTLDALNRVIKNATTDTDDMTEEELVAFDKKVTEANWKLVESLASFLGIPVKNIRREIDGVLDHAKIASANAGMTTSKSVWDKVYDSVIDSIPFMSNKHTKADKLYEAIISGDKTYVERLKSTYKDYSAYQSAVRKALKENDPRIHEAAQARYDGNIEEYKRVFREIQKEGKFTFDDIMSAVNSEVSAIRNKLEPDKATSQYSAGDFVESVAMGNTTEAQAMRENIIATKLANGKTQEEAEKEFASDVATDIGKAYSSGLLDEAQAENMLVEYAGKDEEEAASRVNYWAFCEDHPKYKDVLTEANVAKYHEFAEPAKISVEVYAQFIEGTKGLETKYDEWGDVEVTKREQVLEVIDSLPLTWQQKDALYLAYPYAESQIWDVPW